MADKSFQSSYKLNGEVIQQRLASIHMSIRELSKIIDMTPSALYRAISNKNNLRKETTFKLCETLKLSLNTATIQDENDEATQAYNMVVAGIAFYDKDKLLNLANLCVNQCKLLEDNND